MPVSVDMSVTPKHNFFDKEEIGRTLDKNEFEALKSLASYIRTVARNSIRKAKNRNDFSKPSGNAKPKYHEGSIRDILFAYDKTTRSVVVGPILYPRKGDKQWKPSAKAMPELLEYGGKIVFVGGSKTAKGGWMPKDFRGRPGETADFPARPFMRPAFSKSLTQAKLQQFFSFVK